MEFSKWLYWCWFRFVGQHIMSFLPFLWEWDRAVLYPAGAGSKPDADGFFRFLVGQNHFFSVEIYRKNDAHFPQNRTCFAAFTFVRILGNIAVDVFYIDAACAKVVISSLLFPEFGAVVLTNREDLERGDKFFLGFFPLIGLD